MMGRKADPRSVILFDGVCNLCNGMVKFVIRRDKDAVFSFASLQSDQGKDLLKSAGRGGFCLNTIVLIKEGHFYQKSDAVLEIVRHLGGLWPILAVFKVLPRFLRDKCYDVVASNRYRWFGKSSVCLLPSPELRKRFLDAGFN